MDILVLPYYHWSCQAPAATGGSAGLSDRSPDSSPPEGQKAAEGWIRHSPLLVALSKCPRSPKGHRMRSTYLFNTLQTIIN